MQSLTDIDVLIEYVATVRVEWLYKNLKAGALNRNEIEVCVCYFATDFAKISRRSARSANTRVFESQAGQASIKQSHIGSMFMYACVYMYDI